MVATRSLRIEELKGYSTGGPGTAPLTWSPGGHVVIMAGAAPPPTTKYNYLKGSALRKESEAS